AEFRSLAAGSRIRSPGGPWSEDDAAIPRRKSDWQSRLFRLCLPRWRAAFVVGLADSACPARTNVKHGRRDPSSNNRNVPAAPVVRFPCATCSQYLETPLRRQQPAPRCCRYSFECPLPCRRTLGGGQRYPPESRCEDDRRGQPCSD